MSLGPFLFMAPLALLALLVLPLIWLVLRATPPAPKSAALPSLRLLEGIDPREETPARTPWWLLLLRFLAAAAAILGLSLPLYAPGVQPGETVSGPVLVVIDNGWTSAERWSDMRSVAAGAMDGESRDTPAHLLLTAAQSLPQDPAERIERSQFEARIRSLEPKPWSVDRANALERLNESGLTPSRILWITDGLDRDTSRAFGDSLSDIAPLSIYVAKPRGIVSVSALDRTANGVRLTLNRAETNITRDYYVSALTLEGTALATAQAEFQSERMTGKADFNLPPAALSRISRFQVTASTGVGNVWLWDSASRTRRVGLMSSDISAQPLLSDIHYVRQALKPFASLTEGTLQELINDSPDAIILTDIGQIDPAAVEPLTQWVENGGALIRFAGPRMAANGDTLVPAPLRRSSRAIGGALTWEEPQPLGAFPETSPFAGLAPPSDIRVRQQVLARPGPDLLRRTWARLDDGSPLVTADKRGEGSLVLFHVTAGPDWSDLPLSGIYVEMLRRAIAAGRGEAISEEGGLYTPLLALNGFGRLVQPDSNAAPMTVDKFTSDAPSETFVPGLYQGPVGLKALNVADGYKPDPVTDWPSGATILGQADARTFRLGGPLIGFAVFLIALDLLIALALAGRWPKFGGGAKTAAGLALGLVLISGLQPNADAQGFFRTPIITKGDITPEAAAALDFRLAYVQTGDANTDKLSEDGLNGLSLAIKRRSSVEPAQPHAVDLETASLHVYPILFLGLPDTPQPFSPLAITRLNEYLRQGGALFIDTRQGDTIGQDGFDNLTETLPGLDTPRLTITPQTHVLTKSFYLLDDFPGRYARRKLWIEATAGTAPETRRGDGVSRIFVGDADYLSAWAIDTNGRALYAVDGGNRQREMSYRFGVNLIMYILTGNYKEDQVHIPALLERLGQDEGVGDFDTPEDRGITLDDILQDRQPQEDRE